ncbi:MAG: phosphate signaling complex protein PhoU [Acetobacteraceae bacterium]
MSEHEHIVAASTREVDALKARIMRMGGLAEKLVTDAVFALDCHDVELAARIIVADSRIDALEAEVEEEATLVLARRQPTAVDLREIVASIQIAANLERIGDLAKSIAKRTTPISEERLPRRVNRGICHMTDLALAQLKAVLHAYADRDAARALAVRNRDGEIDAIYNSLFRELLRFMIEEPHSIGASVHLLFCAKNIERVGDHATNIAESVYYATTGERLRGERQKDDSHNYAVVSFPPGSQGRSPDVAP